MNAPTSRPTTVVETSDRATGATPIEQARLLRRSLTVNIVACLVLVVQFLLGMVVNLYVTIPARHPGAGAGNFFSGVGSAIGWVIPNGPTWLAVHVALGLALVVAALANILWAPATRNRFYTFAAVLGALAILGAAFNGASFVNYGHDFSSMIMAGLWALALACYVSCLYTAGRICLDGSVGRRSA